MNDRDILDFLRRKNYDLKINDNNGRWIDQKCTPDVMWSVSDFVLNYIENESETFTVTDIWRSNYAKQTIRETYSKPDTDDASAENEYDKVFSQPLNLLCYADVIEDVSTNSRHLYRVKNKDVLEYIARNDIFALRFLQAYIEKVLKDTGLMYLFEDFFDNQDRNHFQHLKDSFIHFYHKYTPIQKDYEPKRIFSKVLNPLAFKYGKCGTERGRMSKYAIIRADMMYNRDNFRDVYKDKPKGVARKDWLAQHPEYDVRTGYFEQMMNSSKRLVRFINDNYRRGISELTQFSGAHSDMVSATQLHHIFPKNEFPEIMHYPENLIALTPNQHFTFAHPNNNTQIIDLAAQKVLLVAKTYSIKKNLQSAEEHIYSFDDLLMVLSVGWDDENIMEIPDADYNSVVYSINCRYNDYARMVAEDSPTYG